jgi:ribulose-5-phosphate 4-epimerase/fuculose-1-phosphate aldolase
MHSTYGKAWSAFATLLEMINQDVAIFCGDVQALNDNFGSAVLEEEESERLADALGLGTKV